MASDSAGRGGSLELTIRVNAGLGRGSSFAKTATLPDAWFGQAHPEQGVQNIVVVVLLAGGDERRKVFFCHLGPKIGVDLSARVGGAWSGSGR